MVFMVYRCDGPLCPVQAEMPVDRHQCDTAKPPTSLAIEGWRNRDRFIDGAWMPPSQYCSARCEVAAIEEEEAEMVP